MNAKLIKSLDNFALAVGLVLFFGIMISGDLRHQLGSGYGLCARVDACHSALPYSSLYSSRNYWPICQPDSKIHHGLGFPENSAGEDEKGATRYEGGAAIRR